MTYELAKQLKDAGFPLENRNGGFAHFGIDDVAYPTLPELIEACGDGFSIMVRLSTGKCLAGRSSAVFTMEDYPNGTGMSFEEAVANLYLALKAPNIPKE